MKILTEYNEKQPHQSMPEANWLSIPNYMHGAVVRWVLFGMEGGSFLNAVLSNDLKMAVACGDGINKHKLPEWVEFLANDMPIGSHGSPEIVEAWKKAGGIVGIQKKEAEIA